MLQTNQALDLSPIGAKFIVRKTSRDTNGKSLDLEWELEPDTLGTPLHIHPDAIETYIIIEGEMQIYLKDTASLLFIGKPQLHFYSFVD